MTMIGASFGCSGGEQTRQRPENFQAGEERTACESGDAKWGEYHR